MENDDPFENASPHEVINTITLMRIYDVLMSMLNEMDKEVSNELHALHDKGLFRGADPKIAVPDKTD